MLVPDREEGVSVGVRGAIENKVRTVVDGQEEGGCGGDENDIFVSFIQSCIMKIYFCG